MKFVFALMVYLVVGIVLSVGIVRAVTGSPGLLVFSLLAYLAALVKLGCLPSESH